MAFEVLWMFFGPVLLEDGRRRGLFQGPPEQWEGAEKAHRCVRRPVI